MKQTIISLMIFLSISGQNFAQPGPGLKSQKRKEIKEMQIKYIIDKLQLTDKEKEQFIPLYKKFSDEREKLYSEKHKTMRNFKQNSLNLSDKDLLNISDKIIDIDLKLAQLNKEYNEKYKKVLPPIKIILLHQAENEFKRELIRKMHHKMPPK
jgi:hypothetical protein